MNDFKKAMELIKSNENVIFLLSRDDQSFYVSIAVPQGSLRICKAQWQPARPCGRLKDQ